MLLHTRKPVEAGPWPEDIQDFSSSSAFSYPFFRARCSFFVFVFVFVFVMYRIPYSNIEKGSSGTGDPCSNHSGFP